MANTRNLFYKLTFERCRTGKINMHHIKFLSAAFKAITFEAWDLCYGRIGALDK